MKYILNFIIKAIGLCLIYSALIVNVIIERLFLITILFFKIVWILKFKKEWLTPFSIYRLLIIIPAVFKYDLIYFHANSLREYFNRDFKIKYISNKDDIINELNDNLDAINQDTLNDPFLRFNDIAVAAEKLNIASIYLNISFEDFAVYTTEFNEYMIKYSLSVNFQYEYNGFRDTQFKHNQVCFKIRTVYFVLTGRNYPI